MDLYKALIKYQLSIHNHIDSDSSLAVSIGATIKPRCK